MKLGLSQRMGLLVGGCAIAFLVCAIAATILYGTYRQQSEAPFIMAGATFLHLPVASVGSQRISYADYITQLKAERIFLASPAAQGSNLPTVPGSQQKQDVLDRLIRADAVGQWANEQKISVSTLDVDNAFNQLMQHAGTSTTPGEVDVFLNQSFGWNEQQFKDYVVRPALLEEVLRQHLVPTAKDQAAFDSQLATRLKAPNVKMYLKF